MTRTYNITGQTGFFSGLLRSILVGATVIGGLFMFAASAALAFFILCGLSLLAALAFIVFWLKAKITGKPFGPRARFEKARAEFQADLESQFRGTTESSKPRGPVIDMRETPNGWSVDD